MPRARHLIAASLAVLIAGSAVGLYVHRTDEYQIASGTPTENQAIVPSHLERWNALQPIPPLGKDGFGQSYAPLDPSPMVPGQATAADVRDNAPKKESRVAQDRSQQPFASKPASPGTVDFARRPPAGRAYAPDPRGRIAEAQRVDQAQGGRGEGALRGHLGEKRVQSVLIAPPESGAPPPEPVGRDRFKRCCRERLQDRTRSAGLDLLDRRRHRLLLLRGAPRSIATFCRSPPPCEPRSSSTISPTLIRRRRRPASRSAPRWRCSRAPGRKAARSSRSASAAMRCSRRSARRANLVFLIDTSGSMNASNRLPLVKQSLAMLLTQLDANDRVAIVTYAGHAGTALEAHRSLRQVEDPRRDRAARGCRQHRGRRGHPPGLCARRAELRPERRQPRDPGDRRRLQRRHHQSRRAQGLSSSASGARGSSCRSSVSAWAITTTR